MKCINCKYVDLFCLDIMLDNGYCNYHEGLDTLTEVDLSLNRYCPVYEERH